MNAIAEETDFAESFPPGQDNSSWRFKKLKITTERRPKSRTLTINEKYYYNVCNPRFELLQRTVTYPVEQRNLLRPFNY